MRGNLSAREAGMLWIRSGGDLECRVVRCAGIPGRRAVRGAGDPECRESGVQGCLVCGGSAVQERVSFRGSRIQGSPECWGCGVQGIRAAGVVRDAGVVRCVGVVWCVGEPEMPGIRDVEREDLGCRVSESRLLCGLQGTQWE